MPDRLHLAHKGFFHQFFLLFCQFIRNLYHDFYQQVAPAAGIEIGHALLFEPERGYGSGSPAEFSG